MREAVDSASPLKKPGRMIRNQIIAAASVMCIYAAAPIPSAHAEENVTYEVVSNDVAAANIEYFDGTERKGVEDAPLPWRIDVMMANPRSLSMDGAEVRADWRSSIAAPVWRPGHWVTVRIYLGKTLRCQNTLDVGNAACYGSTAFKS